MQAFPRSTTSRCRKRKKKSLGGLSSRTAIIGAIERVRAVAFAAARFSMKGDSMTEMISLEEAQALVLANVAPLSTEVVEVLDAVGRVSAADLASDIDIAPFAH